MWLPSVCLANTVGSYTDCTNDLAHGAQGTGLDFFQSRAVTTRAMLAPFVGVRVIGFTVKHDLFALLCFVNGALVTMCCTFYGAPATIPLA